MASSAEYLEYVLDLLREVPEITARKMMGEYLLYAGGRVWLTSGTRVRWPSSWRLCFPSCRRRGKADKRPPGSFVIRGGAAMLWNAREGSVPIGGTTMRYVAFGRGSRRLVILPGLSDGLATVRGKALLLAPPYQRFLDRFTVYVFSRRDQLPQGHGIRQMAADQAAALDALGIRRTLVMGVSQGGMIAQYLAIDRPDLVERLVLAVTAPCANEMVRDCVRRWIGMAQAGDHKALMVDTASDCRQFALTASLKSSQMKLCSSLAQLRST